MILISFFLFSVFYADLSNIIASLFVKWRENTDGKKWKCQGGKNSGTDIFEWVLFSRLSWMDFRVGYFRNPILTANFHWINLGFTV